MFVKNWCIALPGNDLKTNFLSEFRILQSQVQGVMRGVVAYNLFIFNRLTEPYLEWVSSQLKKSWGWDKMVPPASLYISSQMMMKLDRDILWVELFLISKEI